MEFNNNTHILHVSIVYDSVFSKFKRSINDDLNTSLNTGNELQIYKIFELQKKKIKLKTVKNDKACWHEALNTYDHVHAFSVHLSL